MVADQGGRYLYSPLWRTQNCLSSRALTLSVQGRSKNITYLSNCLAALGGLSPKDFNIGVYTKQWDTVSQCRKGTTT